MPTPITREVQAPGQPTLAAIVEAFGPETLLEDGTLDRAGLAARVFTEPEQLRDAQRHRAPGGRRRDRPRLDALRSTDRVVVLDVPLLVESGRRDLELLVVVDIDPRSPSDAWSTNGGSQNPMPGHGSPTRPTDTSASRRRTW